jgi:GT2 family glycosyltransferase
VSDGGTDEGVAPILAINDPLIRVIRLAESARDAAATARNVGIAAASGEFVALLDDDDEWFPNKLSEQLARATARGSGAMVVSSCVERETPSGTAVWPRRGINPQERVADYLFVRREPGEGWLPTPTLLFPRSLALEVPFGTGMKQHEDIDWLLRLEARGATFEVVMESLAIVHVGESTTSLSGSATWPNSLTWAKERKSLLGKRAYSAFCLTEVSRVARARPSLRAFVTIALASAQGAPRARDVMQFVVSWSVPRSWWAHIHRLRELPRL